MLTLGELEAAFKIYWEDVDQCRRAGAYWSLLHVVVCLPDICASLESADGRATGQRYIDWAEQYFRNQILSGQDRYHMRCKVLHQGRATTDGATYSFDHFHFGQPAPDGSVDHMRIDGRDLYIDVGRLAEDTKKAIDDWIAHLESNLNSEEACNVYKNLPTLVRVRPVSVPSRAGTLKAGQPIASIVNKTN